MPASIPSVNASLRPGRAWLVCRVGARLCVLAATDVVETMRPMSVEVLSGAPEFVVGVSIIRGTATPVVDAALLLGAESTGVRRFVTLRCGARLVALAVDEVLGVRALPDDVVGELAPLLSATSPELVRAMGALDARLLLVLDAARLVPDSLWQTLGTEIGAS